jgi:hypothetical protein
MFRWLTRLFDSKTPDPTQQTDSGASEIPPGAYVIGRTKDLVKLKHLVAADDPRRSLFVYHELRAEDEKQWSREDLRRVLASDDPAGLHHLKEQIQLLNHIYSPQEMQDFVDVQPSAADSTVADLCRRYRVGTRVTQSFLRVEMDFERAWALLTFSKRAAILGVRTGEPDLIRDSLIAHAIENLAAEDVRDNMVALGLVFHCARAIHPEPVVVFDEVAEVAGRAISQLLKDFVRRPDLDRILTSMGWREVQTQQGVGYRWET